MNVSYMNYRIDQSRNPLIIKDFVDSLQMKQVSTNISANINYNFGSKEQRQTVSVGTSFQKFNDENPNTEVFNSSSSQSPFVSYRFSNTVSKYSFFGRVNYNNFKSSMNKQTRLGFSAGGSKRLINNKLNLNASATLYQNKIDGESNGATSMVRARLNYKLIKNHNLNLSLNFINRNFKQDATNNFNELLIRFGYSLRI